MAGMVQNIVRVKIVADRCASPARPQAIAKPIPPAVQKSNAFMASHLPVGIGPA